MTHESTPERPLVTFALFAYNQEKYIREAIEGAFAQTYEPLEVILSDDCSSDRTFKIMKEMAASYAGPHTVKVRKSHENRGTLGHVLDVAQEARGTLLVVAAGDDCSEPMRVTMLWQTFQSTKVSAIYSAARSLSGDTLINEKLTGNCIFSGADIQFGLGATAAYCRSLFIGVPKPNLVILHEDKFFASLIYFHQRSVAYIDEPLIKYRVRNDISSNKKNIKNVFLSTKEHINQRKYRIIFYIKLLKYCRKNSEELCGLNNKKIKSDIKVVNKNIDDEIARYQAILDIYRCGVWGVPSGFAKLNRSDFCEVLPLFFGTNIFCAVKALYRNISI